MTRESAAAVLVVDDEPPIRELLTRLLTMAGHRPLAAPDVEGALRLLAQEHIDLILLDLHMPGPYDGEELLFLLRDRGDDVPIIIVSGWVDDDTAMNHPECVHAVIKKPIQNENLVATVASALEA